ncbi:unnamed protein product [Peronospora farinosa]|uniref:Uncharacterized protein n=1 Tax=Peronospora farinosa TaxID=134698 RepID=A0AAV0UZ11_9STRA|nr:unnamed protein product [Peronospora farinosa]CAI5740601.1 unnamed protein product [Peronospora farinosa]
MDEKVTRSLEQEAIALVNLSKKFAFHQVAPELLEAVDKSTAINIEDAAITDDDASVELLDGNISMKSLLETLKKRKLQHQVKEEETTGSDNGSIDDTLDTAKLPSFRTVFQPQQEKEIAGDEVNTAPELKCKYRTGKCHNARALKSCGDYHNLCNYHRLRANANQRKLDRKKKEQRLQQQQLTANAFTGTSSPRALKQLPIPSSSHAAATALASLVAAQPQHHFGLLQQQRLFLASSVTVQEAGKTNRNRSNGATSGVSHMQEDACSY